MTPETIITILELADERKPVSEIAAVVAMSPGAVYGVLREHRPERKRSPRTRTSVLPEQIRGLAASGIVAPRIAFLLGVTRAYVYRVLGEGMP